MLWQFRWSRSAHKPSDDDVGSSEFAPTETMRSLSAGPPRTLRQLKRRPSMSVDDPTTAPVSDFDDDLIVPALPPAPMLARIPIPANVTLVQAFDKLLTANHEARKPADLLAADA